MSAAQHSQVKLLQYYNFFESQIHKKYVWEQLTIYLVESCTKGQHPQQKSSSLLMAKRCSGGDRVPHSGPAKWRIPRRRRYFSTVSRRRNTGLVQLHSTVLALPLRPNQLLRAHTRTTPAALKRSAPNGVLHVVGEFMTYSYLRQKLKNDHSYCTSGRWRNGWQGQVWLHGYDNMWHALDHMVRTPGFLPPFWHTVNGPKLKMGMKLNKLCVNICCCQF